VITISFDRERLPRKRKYATIRAQILLTKWPGGHARSCAGSGSRRARSNQLTCDDVIAMSDDRGVSHIDDL
jgi:hypothetical protein